MKQVPVSQSHPLMYLYKISPHHLPGIGYYIHNTNFFQVYIETERIESI